MNPGMWPAMRPMGVGGIGSGAYLTPTGQRLFEFVTADPRTAGLARAIGSTAVLMSGGSVSAVYEKVGSGNSDWVKVNAGGYGELTGAGTALDVTGLDLDADKGYDFVFFAKNSGGGDIDLVGRPNANTSNLRSVGTLAASATINHGVARGNSDALQTGELVRANGITQLVYRGGCYNAATGLAWNMIGQWNDVANVTSYRFVSTGNMAAGSFGLFLPKRGDFRS